MRLRAASAYRSWRLARALLGPRRPHQSPPAPTRAVRRAPVLRARPEAVRRRAAALSPPHEAPRASVGILSHVRRAAQRGVNGESPHVYGKRVRSRRRPARALPSPMMHDAHDAANRAARAQQLAAPCTPRPAHPHRRRHPAIARQNARRPSRTPLGPRWQRQALRRARSRDDRRHAKRGAGYVTRGLGASGPRVTGPVR